MSLVSNPLGLANHLIGRAVLQSAAQLLAARGIALMPLKGIWLQHVVYADPTERPITDVDVLVPFAEYDEALRVLERSGWTRLLGNVSEFAMVSPDFPMPLDVHRRLFTRGAFGMPSDELFARGTSDGVVFDCEVILPDPLDVFAHLVGHFVKSRGGRDTRSRELRDLPRIAERCTFDADRTARHLEGCGLARAARYALRCVRASEDESGFCAATLAALSSDPVGQLCAGGMLHLRRRVDVGSAMAALPGFMLESSLPRALRSLALRAWDRRYDHRPT